MKNDITKQEVLRAANTIKQYCSCRRIGDFCEALNVNCPGYEYEASKTCPFLNRLPRYWGIEGGIDEQD